MQCIYCLAVAQYSVTKWNIIVLVFEFAECYLWPYCMSLHAAWISLSFEPVYICLFGFINSVYFSTAAWFCWGAYFLVLLRVCSLCYRASKVEQCIICMPLCGRRVGNNQQANKLAIILSKTKHSITWEWPCMQFHKYIIMQSSKAK